MGDEEKSGLHREVINGHAAYGREQQWQMQADTDVAGAGLITINGKRDRITTLVNATGAGLFMQTANTEGGFGGEERLPTNIRGTKHFATQSGDKSKQTLLALCNADGSGLRIQSGGGVKPVVHLAIADGTSSITLTEGYIAVQCMGTETIWHGREGKISVTYQIIQEHIKGYGKTVVV